MEKSVVKKRKIEKMEWYMIILTAFNLYVFASYANWHQTQLEKDRQRQAVIERELERMRREGIGFRTYEGYPYYYDEYGFKRYYHPYGPSFDAEDGAGSKNKKRQEYGVMYY